MHQSDNKNTPDQSGGHGPTDPLLVSVEELARLLQISKRTISRDRLTGDVPPPVRVGKLVRWRLDIIVAWIADGCPHMDDWEMPNGDRA